MTLNNSIIQNNNFNGIFIQESNVVYIDNSIFQNNYNYLKGGAILSDYIHNFTI